MSNGKRCFSSVFLDVTWPLGVAVDFANWQ